MKATKLWGGRFSGEGRDALFESFSESFSLDQRLILYDLRVNHAYLKQLAAAGVLKKPEAARLTAGLESIRREVQKNAGWAEGESSEDVHTWVEARLEQKVGALAGKLRTGRSRNDLAVTETRLFAKDGIDAIEGAAAGTLEALLNLGRRYSEAIMPGYTHLQPAQPVLFSHYALAYFEMFWRDTDRLEDCRRRADELPMGAGALAGAAFPIDREALAQELGFASASANSLDAVSDRDFVCELTFVCALALVHLSRLAEDLILYSSPAFSFVEIADAYATGSSLMPQKKNADSLELIRGRAARVLGRATGALALMKGLPMSYDRDLQEDKAALFDSVDSARDALILTGRVLRTLSVNPEKMEVATQLGFLTATDVADELVRRGAAFASAHESVGKLVRRAIKEGKSLAELSEADARESVPGWDDALARIAASPRLSISRRNVLGGTAGAQVKRQLARAERRVEQLKRRLAARS